MTIVIHGVDKVFLWFLQWTVLLRSQMFHKVNAQQNSRLYSNSMSAYNTLHWLNSALTLWGLSNNHVNLSTVQTGTLS